MRFAIVLSLPLAAALAVDPAPKTPQKPVTETLHGVSLTDPYRWLEDQRSPETRAWIEEQTAYTGKYLAGLRGRGELRRKLEPLFRTDVMTMPSVAGGRYFFMRRLAGENRMSICMRQGATGEIVTLVRPDEVSADASVSIALSHVSDDGKLMLYTVRQGGEDEVELRFFNVEKRQLLSDRLEHARYFGFALRPDGKGVYYSRLFKEGSRPVGTKILFHATGTAQNSDRIVFSKGTGLLPTDSVGLSEDGRYLVLYLEYGTSARTEVRIKDLSKDGPVIDVTRSTDAQFRPDIIDGRIYLHTNWKAPNWRVIALPASDPKLENAVDVIPEGKLPLGGFNPAGGRLWASYLENVQTKIYEFTPDGRSVKEFALPGAGSASVPVGKWTDKEVFFNFGSFTTPGRSYRVDVATGKRDVWFEPELPIDTSKFTVEQVWYPSKDGTRVPMFVVKKKDLKLDGNRPTLLYGYGGFNVSQVPAFTVGAVLWPELDGVYAVANLRGGGEFGETWHKAAMHEKKQNTFDDFIAAAEYLQKNGYTKPGRLAIQGGSNGGLLVGAAMTQRPELYGAVLCAVPLLDMLRYDKFLLGKFWITEYGTADDPKQFKYLLKYSPYHHVENGVKYPSVMFSSGDSDTRVDPLHARKMTALVQSASASGKPVVLKYDTKAGHSGGKPVDQLIEDAVDHQLFLLNAVGAEIK